MATNKPKKDFAGKNKTKDTYDKDWVFHNGAWVTKRQRKDAISDVKQHKAYLASINGQQAAPIPTTPAPGSPTPGTPTPPTLVPILPPNLPTPGSSTSPDLVTNIQFGGPPATNPEHVNTPGVPGSTLPRDQRPPRNSGGPPSWWINTAYKNPTEDQAFANAANALLPSLSPEDQRTLASYLAINYKDAYGGYANANFGPIPTKLTNERQTFLNPQRAQQTLSILDKLQAATGQAEMGKGYDFLRNAVNLMTKYQSNGPMTREQYDQFAAAVAALTSQAGKDISAYSNLAQMFNLPNFTAGPLVSNTANARLNV